MKGVKKHFFIIAGLFFLSATNCAHCNNDMVFDGDVMLFRGRLVKKQDEYTVSYLGGGRYLIQYALSKKKSKKVSYIDVHVEDESGNVCWTDVLRVPPDVGNKEDARVYTVVAHTDWCDRSDGYISFFVHDDNEKEVIRGRLPELEPSLEGANDGVITLVLKNTSSHLVEIIEVTNETGERLEALEEQAEKTISVGGFYRISLQSDFCKAPLIVRYVVDGEEVEGVVHLALPYVEEDEEDRQHIGDEPKEIGKVDFIDLVELIGDKKITKAGSGRFSRAVKNSLGTGAVITGGFLVKNFLSGFFAKEVASKKGKKKAGGSFGGSGGRRPPPPSDDASPPSADNRADQEKKDDDILRRASGNRERIVKSLETKRASFREAFPNGLSSSDGVARDFLQDLEVLIQADEATLSIWERRPGPGGSQVLVVRQELEAVIAELENVRTLVQQAEVARATRLEQEDEVADDSVDGEGDDDGITLDEEQNEVTEENDASIEQLEPTAEQVGWREWFRVIRRRAGEISNMVAQQLGAAGPASS